MALQLVEDLRKELQRFSEELAQMFPDRVKRYTDRDLSRLWRGSNFQYISRIRSKITNHLQKDYKPDFRFSDKESNLRLLEEILNERLGSRASSCLAIIKLYEDRDSGITTLQFIDMIENELGRISGEVILTDQELSFILAGYSTFIRDILDTITNRDSQRWYNPDYKFTQERLDDFKQIFEEILYNRAEKCLELVKKYEESNSDIKYFHPKDYSIEKPNFFDQIDSVEKAYWYGFLCADGHLSLVRSRIQFELSLKDKDFIVAFMKEIGLNLERIEERRQFMTYRGEVKSYQSARIRFSSDSIKAGLIDLGFDKFKSGEIGIPDFVKALIAEARQESSSTGLDWSLTKSGKIALAWLLGFYDGDGTYISGRNAKIYSSNKRLLDEIKSLLGIENLVRVSYDVSEDDFIELRQIRGTKNIYGLTLGPSTFDSMIQSYDKSMARKRPNNNRQRFIDDYP